LFCKEAKGKKMTTEKYLCPNCKKSVELTAKPKRSFMGFLRIPCPNCQKEFRYPLKAGYVVVYWILLAINLAWITYILSQGERFFPNPIGVIVLIYVIISLVKNTVLKDQIAERQKLFQ
jgi:DNA-directed RNA polymerase subunit RPC12/RpoP